MAGRYSIETIFKLIDNISAPLDKIGVKGSKVSKIIKRDFVAAQDTLDGLGKKLKKLPLLAAGAGTVAVGAGLAVATKQFIEFDDALHKAGAVFSDLDPRVNTFKGSLAALGSEARKVAAATEFNAQQAAGALSAMAMAGIKSDQAIALLPKTADLATAAGVELSKAASMAADSLGVFNMMSDDPAKLANNFGYISDILAKASSIANMDISLMFEAASQGGAQFTKANQSIEDFGAAIDALASKNIKGSEAGRAVNIMMTKLAAPAKAGADAIKELGLKTRDTDGNILNFIDIIGQMEKKFKGMGTAQIAGYINAIFGKQYLTQATALIDIGTDKLRDYSAQLREASGAAAQMAGVMRGSIANKIEVLKSALTELGFKFVEAFQEKGVGLIDRLTDAVSNFDPQPIIDAATIIGERITDIIQIIWDLKYVIMGAAVTWGIYKGLMLAAAIAVPIFDMVKAVQTLMKAQEGLNVVQAVFNYLLTTNPIGLAAVAIGILVGLIVTCEGKIQRLMGVLQILGMVLAVVFGPALAAISPLLVPIVFFIGLISSMVYELISNWEMLVETFRTDGIIAGLKRLVGVLLSGLLMPIQGLLELLAKIPGVGKFFEPAVDQMQKLRNSLKGIENEPEKNPSEAASSTVKAASAPASVTNPVPAVSPSITGPISAAQTAAIRQPALLNIREGRLFSAGPVKNPAMALVTQQSPAASPVPPPLAQAVPRTVQEAASIPVKYDFPEMIVPPELVRPVSVPVSWAYSPPLQTSFTTTASPASPVPASLARAVPPAAAGRIVPPAIANSDPARVDRIVPPAAGYPVAPSVAAAMVPPASPMTRAEQMAAEQVLYSRTENYEKIDLEISLDKGLEARVVNPPKSPNVKLEISGTV